MIALPFHTVSDRRRRLPTAQDPLWHVALERPGRTVHPVPVTVSRSDAALPPAGGRIAFDMSLVSTPVMPVGACGEEPASGRRQKSSAAPAWGSRTLDGGGAPAMGGEGCSGPGRRSCPYGLGH